MSYQRQHQQVIITTKSVFDIRTDKILKIPLTGTSTNLAFYCRTEVKLESLEDAVVLEEYSDDLLSDKHGCPAYVSPEILRSNTQYSGRAADMWGLGVMLYTMLVGRWDRIILRSVKCDNNVLSQVSISWCWTQRPLCKNKTRPVYSSRKSQFTRKMSYQMFTEERPKRENYDWRRSRPSLAARLQQRAGSAQKVPGLWQSGPGSPRVEPTGRVIRHHGTLGIQWDDERSWWAAEIIFRASNVQTRGRGCVSNIELVISLHSQSK